MSQPCAFSIRATATASSGSIPPGIQSTALMRTLIGFSSGHTERHASKTSSGNRMRLSSEPPYSSARVFVSGEMNDASRYPCAMWTSSRSKPASRARPAASAKAAMAQFMSARVISRGTELRSAKYGIGDAETRGHPPSASGSLSPSHNRCVAPFRPACPSCTPIAAGVSRWTNSTMRFHAAACSGRYSPAHHGEMRASRDTSVISAITSPAPPIARLPRCTRCQSPIVPSSATY